MTTGAAQRIVVVGSGARERALAARLNEEDGVDARQVEPAPEPERREVALRELVDREGIDLVVFGPEGPLVGGVAERLREGGATVFGPGKAAARLEASKSFAREIARAAGVAIAEGDSFDDLESAIVFARRIGPGVVVKADGLAAGKGVTVCETHAEAEAAIRSCAARFGAAGARIVVEERLTGREASVIAICDGLDALALPPARDHKRVGVGDTGPNTGGMGAFSPLDDFPDAKAEQILERFHRPVLRELARRGIRYSGALYAGLMLTADGPRLLEFNVRFGDPETQAVLPRTRLPLADVLMAAARGRLGDGIDRTGMRGVVPADPDVATVAIVVAARGYPDEPHTGERVTVDRDGWPAAARLHWAGVREEPLGGGDAAIITSGGRVATVVGSGLSIAEAARAAYAGAERVRFPSAFYRADIGVRRASLAGAAA
jgi:phosphoribosylamine--glycine ligase